MNKVAIFDSLTNAQATEIDHKVRNKINAKANSILHDPNKSVAEINTMWSTHKPIIDKRRSNIFSALQRDATMRLKQEDYRRTRGLYTGLDSSKFDLKYEDHPRMTQSNFNKLVRRNEFLDPLRMNKKSIIGAIGAAAARGILNKTWINKEL